MNIPLRAGANHAGTEPSTYIKDLTLIHLSLDLPPHLRIASKILKGKSKKEFDSKFALTLRRDMRTVCLRFVAHYKRLDGNKTFKTMMTAVIPQKHVVIHPTVMLHTHRPYVHADERGSKNVSSQCANAPEHRGSLTPTNFFQFIRFKRRFSTT